MNVFLSAHPSFLYV